MTMKKKAGTDPKPTNKAKQTTPFSMNALVPCRRTLYTGVLVVLILFWWAVTLTNTQGTLRLVVAQQEAAKNSTTASSTTANQTTPRNNHFSNNTLSGGYRVSNAAIKNTTTATTKTTTTPKNLPWPDRVVEQYIAWHSADALRHELQSQTPQQLYSRQYAVAYYYCPERAGNLLHSLFISVTWAMVTNRTLLLAYDTDHNIDKDHSKNTVKDCQAVLQRASWIPWYDDFIDLLQPLNSNTTTNTSTTIQPIGLDVSQITQESQYPIITFPSIRDVQQHHTNYFRLEWRDDPMHKSPGRQYIKALGKYAKSTAAQLYYHGTDYLLGMLFSYMFQFTPIVTNAAAVTNGLVAAQVNDNTTINNNNNNTWSFALHSRHTVVGDDGSFIQDEIRCLQQVLPLDQQENCVVYLISDRPQTVQLLTQWLQQHESHCTGISTLDTSSTAAAALDPQLWVDEHGPHPGVGFLQDLYLAQHARSGLIGDTERSSFMLLQELVTYQRMREDWQKLHNGEEEEEGDDGLFVNPRPDNPLVHCKLPGRYGKGYNYGPGTPTFRAMHWRKKLPPIQVLQQYQQWHSSAVVLPQQQQSNGGPEQRFAVSYLPCPVTAEALPAFQNDLLRAIASNRTLLWSYKSCPQCSRNETALRECEPNLRIASWLPSLDEWGSEHNNLANPVEDSQLMMVFPKENNPIISKEALAEYVEDSSTLDDWKLDDPLLDMLYEQGADFLHGMLLDRSVSMRNRVRQPGDGLHPFNPQVFSVAYYGNDDDGDNSDYEQTCLQQMLVNQTAPCHIYPVNTGRHAVSPPRCSIVSIESTNQTNDGDLTFFQNLLFVADRVRSAFVGPANNTKANLTRQRIEYLRRHKVWTLGRLPPILPPFLTCSR